MRKKTTETLKIPMTIRVSDDLLRQIDDAASLKLQSRADVIREALQESVSQWRHTERPGVLRQLLAEGR